MSHFLCSNLVRQTQWKSWCRRNSYVVASLPDGWARPNVTSATIPGPQDPIKPSLVELRRQVGYLQLLANRQALLGPCLTASPYNMPPVLMQQLITINDVQSLIRRMGARGVHFDPPVAMDIIMLTSRLCSWYSRERDEP